MRPQVNEILDRLLSRVSLPVGAVVTILLFLFAVRLLGTATEAGAPVLRQLIHRLVVGDASALGLGWLGAYVLANGSVVAALGLSLFTVEILSAPQLFLVIAGSRLGAAAIVVFIGALDWIQKERYTLQKSVRMGLLTFTLTHSIYLPVTIIGYLALPVVHDPVLRLSRGWDRVGLSSGVLSPIFEMITATLGPILAFVLAIGVLLTSLKLIDRVLAEIDTRTIRDHVFSRFRNPALSFGIGLLVTGVSTSVAFSLGVIVPLYNRGYIDREELIPYVLGANLGTLVDTLVVAVVLRTAAGITVVLVLLTIASLATLGALLGLSRYSRVLGELDDRLVEDRRAFLAFVVVLLLGPVLLLVGPAIANTIG